jgi:integrase
MGTPPGQSCARRRLADAEDSSTEVGLDDGTGKRAACAQLPLARTMVGLAILSGVRRRELFALRWQDIDEPQRGLTVREAVYDGSFGTPKTEAGVRQIPLPAAAIGLLTEWRCRSAGTEPMALVFSTRGGKPISPNNVLRPAVFPHVSRSDCRMRRG